MDASMTQFLSRLAKALSAQFGPNCEAAVHDLQGSGPEHSIAAIENGHVSGRRIGDGLFPAVLEALNSGAAEDQLSCLTKTADGRTLKSTALCLRDGDGTLTGIFSVSYDITPMLAMEETLHQFTAAGEARDDPPEPAIRNVSDLLDELIQQSVKRTGRPVQEMTKEDKVKAIGFLNDTGAFLVTKSGERVCRQFGISKYTLYSYIDEAKGGKE